MKPKSLPVDLQVHLDQVLDLFKHFTKAPCYLLSVENLSTWVWLNHVPRLGMLDKILEHFEPTGSDHFNKLNFQKVIKEKKTILAKLWGLWVWFVPVLQKKQCVGILVSGDIFRAMPQRKELETQWKKWTGKTPAEGDLKFVEYVRALLLQPILESPLDKAHGRLLEIIAELLAGEKNSTELIQEVQSLRVKLFSKKLPVIYWDRDLLNPLGVFPRSIWPKGKSKLIDKMDLGISREPTRALLVVLVDPPGKVLDPVDRLLRQKIFEREAYRFARNHLSETVFFPYGGLGGAFLTSSAHSFRSFEYRQEFLTLVKTIRQYLESFFKTGTRVGVGEAVAPGESPRPSLDQAFEALQWATYQEKDQVEFLSLKKVGEKNKKTDIWDQITLLVEAVRTGDRNKVELEKENLFRSLWRTSGGVPETGLIHFQHTLLAVSIALESKNPKATLGLKKLTARKIDEFRLWGTLTEQTAAFRTGLDELVEFARKPKLGLDRATLKEIQTLVKNQPGDSWKLENAAKLAGMSRATFSRRFHEMAGMPFHSFLVHSRLEFSKGLLMGTDLPVHRIAQDCGFAHSGHYSQAFQKLTKVSPLSYRKKRLSAR